LPRKPGQTWVWLDSNARLVPTNIKLLELPINQYKANTGATLYWPKPVAKIGVTVRDDTGQAVACFAKRFYGCSV